MTYKKLSGVPESGHPNLTAHPGSTLSERVDFPAPARTRSVD